MYSTQCFLVNVHVSLFLFAKTSFTKRSQKCFTCSRVSIEYNSLTLPFNFFLSSFPLQEWCGQMLKDSGMMV